ncbi:Os03g0836050 [Oryza sativa Japonica Group]|uniref:Os03g0836050 protein n=1 Tax=Oryza sativa subsp. japonica TaxID=39947 RepID=A0A0P0W599_ORYSJ|nr:hypothetical protein EE612_021524 [Oryza sativa]BAS87254.1 Os03g0836050 [Oryza sativa Japonica Group]
MDPRSFHPNQRGLEQHFWAPEPLCANCDDLSIWQLIALLNRGAALGSLQLLLIIKSNICKLLFYVSHNFPLCSCCKGITSFCKDLH